MKLVAIIVLYNPDITFLKNNIITIIDDVDHLLLYRNSPLNEGEELFKNEKITFLGDGQNIGISGALNKGVDWAELNKYSHLLTLDQDSSFAEGHLNRFKERIINEPMIDIGIYCPNIANRGVLLKQPRDLPYIVVDSITSGSIFSVNTFKICGNFDTRLFIDAVDYEFCYRIMYKNNLKTIIYPDIILNHEVGYPTKIRFGFTTDNYSAFRTYYIVRNHIIIWKRYPKLFQPSYKKTLVKVHILSRIIKIIIGEKDKINKLRSIGRGLFHGLFNENI